MIVDVHTHTPTHRDAVPSSERLSYDSWRVDRAVVTTNSWADFDVAMEGVDAAIVFNIDVPDPLAYTGLATDPARINESTAEFVADAPARRIGFMSVNPTRPDAIDEVERCRELGLVGVKLGANYQQFDPLGDDALAFYAHAERVGLPILFHQGASPIQDAPLRYAHPLVTDEIAMRHPELRIVMAHMGHPWVRETVVTIRKHPNVYADVSAVCLRPWMLYEALLFATEWGATHKLLLGSDFPVSTPRETTAALERVNDIVEGTHLPRIPDDTAARVTNSNALDALGLRLPPAAADLATPHEKQNL
jgi:predicted TIM-barrel fold metal-dependent hydrolase